MQSCYNHRMKIQGVIFAAFAAASVSAATLTVPAPTFADTESATGAVLRATAPRALSRFTLDAACRNLATNAFELRFGAASEVDGDTLRLVIGFDNGAWYASGADPASLAQTTNAAPSGAFALKIAVTFNNDDSFAAISALANGAHVPCLEAAIAATDPKAWRGIKAVSCRTDGPQPVVTSAAENLGLKVIIR